MSEQQVVLVTGASTGIGESIARHLADKGFIVYGTSRRMMTDSDSFRWIQLDVNDMESIQKCIKMVLDNEGCIDVLINNAGLGMVSALEEAPYDNIRQVMDTNFFGVVRMIKTVLPHMRRAGKGKIINISSMGGQMGLPFRSIYSASKFALEGLTEALRQEAAKFGIQACTVLPGSINTDIADKRVSHVPEKSPYNPEINEAHVLMNEEVKKGIDRLQVARKVGEIIARDTLPSKVVVAKPFQQLVVRLKRYLPASLFEKMMMNHYGLKRKV